MKHREQSSVGLGAASLIMILLVLCLALMGVLSLMSARADLTLSRRYAQLAEGYANASAEAQAAIARLDEQLAEAHIATQDETQYAKACTAITEAGGAQVVWESDSLAVMQFDAHGERSLEVFLERKTWPEARKARYSIIEYRLMDAKEWEQTESLILMDM